MPAVSAAQQKLMGADLARARAGKRTRTGMSEAQLKEYAATPRKGLPARKGSLKDRARKIAAARVARRQSAPMAQRSMAAKRSAGGAL